jgi:hypothetical protein
VGAKRPLIAVVAIVFSQACYHWTTAKLDPKPGTEQVRVTLVGGGQILVTGPFLSGDSLVWFARTKPDAMGVSLPDTLNRMGVPLAQVYKLQVHRLDPVATSLALVTTAGVVAAVIAAASWDGLGSGSTGSSGSGGGGSCDYCASCPLVYSWDGRNWRLDSGTFGGAITHGLERTDLDNLDYIAAADGIVHLKVKNELNETDYLDALRVVAVDHSPEVTVAPDGAGRLYTLGALTHPVTARDYRGADALAKVRAADGVSWQSSFFARDTSRLTDIRDGLDLTFVRPGGARSARLVLDGHNTPWAASMLTQFIAAHGSATRAWYDSLDGSPEMARRTGQALAHDGFLAVAIRQGESWQPQGMFWEAGPEIVKRQVLPLDLSGVSGDTVHIRLESAPSFWFIDQVAIDFSPEREVVVTELQASRATFGNGSDIRPDLASSDGQALTLERGDSAILEFQPPPIPGGSARTYLLQSTGWYRIHSPEVGAPALALLQRMQTEPYAGSRFSVARLNQLLDGMRSNALQAGVQ